jgi:hypothetical protein
MLVNKCFLIFLLKEKIDAQVSALLKNTILQNGIEETLESEIITYLAFSISE